MKEVEIIPVRSFRLMSTKISLCYDLLGDTSEKG